MLPTLAVYLHDLNPYFIKLWNTGAIRWYGLSYVLGFVLAYFVILRVARVGVASLKPELVSELIVWLAFGVVIGGRLGYVVFYQRSLLGFDGGFPYWGVLRINQGGMASHGGMIGGIVASWLFARHFKVSWAHMLDLFAFGAPLGLFFGRIANFINGELFGRECSPTMAWAVKFPQEMYHWKDSDAGRDLLASIAPVLNFLPGQAPATRSGAPLAEVVNDNLDRIIDAIQHHNQNVITTVSPLLTPRHPSQLYEALLEGLLVFAVLGLIWARPRKPLVVGSVFCIVYALVRIVGEQFRMPDAHIMNEEFARWGITRGQQLSAYLLLAGVVILVLALRRKTEPIGGWMRSKLPGEAPAPIKQD